MTQNTTVSSRKIGMTFAAAAIGTLALSLYISNTMQGGLILALPTIAATAVLGKQAAKRLENNPSPSIDRVPG